MMFRGHHPIFGCIDHSSLPRKLLSPGRRRSERRGTLKGVPSMKFRNGKPERFALAIRSGLSLHLHGDKVERRAAAWPLAARAQQAELAVGRAVLNGAHNRGETWPI